MMKSMNKKAVVGIVIAVLMILGILGTVALKSLNKTEVVEEVPIPTVVLPTISENIKVVLTSKNGNKTIVLKINGIPADVESIEYELTYTTGTGLPRGVLGKIKTNGQSSVIRDDVDLGTCSRGKCVYDTGVTEVNLSLKFNSTTGEASVFQKTYPL